jgi:hypothetical protein
MRFEYLAARQAGQRHEVECLDGVDAVENGHPALAAAALICFWWLQRPENVLDGHLTWHDYRPADHPNHVKIFHHKTDVAG